MTEMPLRVKNSKLITRLNNDRGQAAIEYVLLLVISVSMVLALVYQIFTPMQKFVNSYMGTYVECLLETGALPSFGGDGVPSASDMGCTLAKFESVSSNSSDASSAGGRSRSDSNDSNSSSSKNSSSDRSSGGGSYAGSSSRGGSQSINSFQRRGTSGVEASAAKGKVTEIPVADSGSGSFFQTSNGRGYSVAGKRAKTSSVSTDNLSAADKKKLEKKQEQKRSVAVSSDDAGPAPKKMIVKKPEPKASVIEDDKPFTVGNFIRYLFIAALIIALVIFIGGQALSMSKEREG